MSSSASLLGVGVDDLSLEELMDFIATSLRTSNKRIVSYANIHALNLAYELSWFRNFLNESDVTFCDGFGVMLAARLTGQKIENRYTPPDFVISMCDLAARNNAAVFLLGARPGVAGEVTELVRARFPSLRIESHHGYFDKSPESRETALVRETINNSQADMLLVGLGMPAQEEWISQNLKSLNIKLAFPVGALFDYISGNVWRAPRWMTDRGLEWVGRLAIEPRRLWKRYLIGNPLFFWRIFDHHVLGNPLPR